LISLLPEIEEALKQSGEALPRPIYSGGSSGNEGQGDLGNQSPSKQNIDATSDEDEED
jgi:hypothetical protein